MDPIGQLADFVATVSAKDQHLGDWLQRALAAFFAGEAVPTLDRRSRSKLTIYESPEDASVGSSGGKESVADSNA